MITNLTINNYKCLVDCSLNLKSLNLLVGPNSSGKSTIIQALLTALDNITEYKGKHNLKASRIDAFSFNEIISFVTKANSYEISASFIGGDSVNLCFTSRDNSLQTILVEQLNDVSPSGTTRYYESKEPNISIIHKLSK